ncbi:MAG: His-Xaa-Ser system radical SAM maturase HxsB [Clostridiales Family XIII bacterium]|jgi:His-Xaa-Ser system radical SAM maturase HxsB|nr:His-Xaa-Ser system radical SAM maturase HxsB [Clostridiales Family XIII bacterium]
MLYLLPFDYRKINSDKYVVINQCGDFYFLDNNSFLLLYNQDLPADHPDYLNLKSRSFFYTDENKFNLSKISAKYRSKLSFLRDFTTLHMLVVTLRCNQRCLYCQVSCADESALAYDMSIQTAGKVIEAIFQSPSKTIKIEFQGGEPTLNWDTVSYAVLFAEEKSKLFEKNIEFVLCTNLTTITPQQLEFCALHNIAISTSLDGPSFIHDKYRISLNKTSTYEIFMHNYRLAKSIVGNRINALMTTTAYSLNYLPQIIDEYINLGFDGIFIRSINPYGFAVTQNNLLNYQANQFVDAYTNALDYIFEINKTTYFQEYFASILFKKIFTPYPTGFVDLQSPAGTGISGVIYDYDGNVFPSDEARMLARMGDEYFKLGNVFTQSYLEIFNGEKLRNIIKFSCNEIIPSCVYCAYKIFCGADPVRNYLESGKILRDMTNTFFCKKNKLIFDWIFDFISNMSECDENIIWSWLNPQYCDHNA